MTTPQSPDAGSAPIAPASGPLLLAGWEFLLPRAGDIGTPKRHIEFEPFPEEAPTEPIHIPAPAEPERVPEEVPA